MFSSGWRLAPQRLPARLVGGRCSAITPCPVAWDQDGRRAQRRSKVSQDIICCDRGGWSSGCCLWALLPVPLFLSSSFYPAHRRQMSFYIINICLIFLV